MIILAVDWEEQLSKAFKGHNRRFCRNSWCICHKPGALRRQIAGIKKELEAGRAKVTETLTADSVLLNAGCFPG